MINLSFCPNQNINSQIYEPPQSSLTYIPIRSITSAQQPSCASTINSSYLNHQYPQFDESTIMLQQQQQQQHQQYLSSNNVHYNFKNPNYVTSSNQIQTQTTIKDRGSQFQQSHIQAHPIPRPTSISSPNSSPGPIVSGVNLSENYVTLNSLQNYSQQLKISSLPSTPNNNNNNTNNQTRQNFQPQIQQQHIYPNYSSIVAALATGTVESKAPWTADEDETLTKMYEQIGPQWARISEVLPGRTISQIRSRRNAIESRKRQRQKAAMKQLKLSPDLKHKIEQRKQVYDQKYESRSSAASSSPVYNSYIGSYKPPVPSGITFSNQNVNTTANTSMNSSNSMKETQNEKFYCSIESLLN